MVKKAALCLFLLISATCFAQKVKLKNNVILIDDVAWLNYQDCGTFDETCSILNKNNEEVIFMKWISVDGAEPMTKSNPQGTLRYVEVKFLGYNQMFEIAKSQKAIIALLYNSKVVTESGELDQDKAAILVEKYGSEFSTRLNGPAPTNTIIIKESPQARPGVNINIGR